MKNAAPQTPPSPQDAGFTLVELLFVIGTVAIIAAFLFSSVMSFKRKSEATVCLANMRTMYTAIMLYKVDHNGLLPPGRLLGSGDSQSIAVGNLLRPKYLSELPYCPSMRLSAMGISELRGQSEKERLREMGSYVMNSFLAYTRMESLPGPYWGSLPYPGNHKMLFIAESYLCGSTWSFEHQRYALDGADWASVRVAKRDHGGKRLNFMFLDGHAVPIAPDVKDGGAYDWKPFFDSWGRDGKYINARGVIIP